MEKDEKEVENGDGNEGLSSCGGDRESEKVEEEQNESSSLLPAVPVRKGGTSRKTNKTRRKVQWKDRNGNKLVEVLEYEPSDVSDSDDEDVDSCICLIM